MDRDRRLFLSDEGGVGSGGCRDKLPPSPPPLPPSPPPFPSTFLSTPSSSSAETDESKINTLFSSAFIRDKEGLDNKFDETNWGEETASAVVVISRASALLALPLKLP